MSREVIAAVIRGARGFVEEAEKKLTETIKAKGEDQQIAFPETAFYLPMSYALMGLELKTVGGLKAVLDHCRDLLPQDPTENLWLPYLGDGLDAGIATLLALEATCALRYVNEEPIEEGCTGFISDTILRELGIQLVDGRMPGFAAVLGPAPSEEIAVNTVRELQKRSILTFLVCNRDGTSMKDQLIDQGVELGWDTYIVPVGRDTQSAIYVLNWAIRGALTFGGHPKGDWRSCLKYCKDRIFAFGISFGPIPDDWYAVGAAAIDMGFPVISDHESTPEIRATGVTTYEALVRQTDYDQLIPTCIEVRGVKVKIEDIDIPVSYSPAFEGERVRREDMHVQFGGKYTDAFEFLKTLPMDAVEDGKIEVVGPEVEQMTEGEAYPLGIVVEVAGRKFQDDFESVLERRIHEYISCANGIFHMGQRSIIWVRISKDAHAKGFKIKDFGEILVAKIHNDFSAIVDRVQVTLITDPEKVKAPLEEARIAYGHRDDRIGGMTDEDVDDFYSCTLCQSYAPDHCCIVTPQRLGLCGAYTWLDCKASHQINAHGPNEPVAKGEVIDADLGQWTNINEYVSAKSNGNLAKFSAYSMLIDPMTSCGCFECIAAIMPESNGIIIVDRDHQGMTPIGMKFSTLAGQIGGGVQTPGFVGIGKLYISSPKFISAEGGIERVVWMPRALKEEIADRLKARLEDIGKPELFDKIATEEDATEPDQLVEYLQKVEHPALTMAAMF